MTELPERIWVHESSEDGWIEQPWDDWTEYTRTDLAAAQARAAWEAGRDAAVRALDFKIHRMETAPTAEDPKWRDELDVALKYIVPVLDDLRALQPTSEFQLPTSSQTQPSLPVIDFVAELEAVKVQQAEVEQYADEIRDNIRRGARRSKGNFQIHPPETPTSPSDAMVERAAIRMAIEYRLIRSEGEWWDLSADQREPGLSIARAALEAALNGEG